MKRFTAFFLSLALLCLSGCGGEGSIYSNYREIEQMQLIRTLGFDRAEEGVRVSVSGGQKGEYTAYTRMSAAGDSISSALDTLQDYTAWEELYYAHTQYALIGQSLAEQDLTEVLDYMERSPQLRADVTLFLVKDAGAEDLVLHCGGEDSDITSALDSVVRDSRRRGDGYAFSLQDVITSLAENGAALLCALEPKPLSDVHSSEGGEEASITPITCGYAILKGTRLAGFLPAECSRGVNFLMNQPGTGDLTLDGGDAGAVTLTITEGGADLTPLWDDGGRLTGIRAEITSAAFVKEVQHTQALDTEALTLRFSAALERWVRQVLETMAETEADFLGVGPALRLKDPRRWAQMPQSWEDALPQLTFELHASCEILRTDRLQ